MVEIMKAKKSHLKFTDDFGRKWLTDMGDLQPGDTVWLGYVTAKIIEFDPKVGLTSVLHEWIDPDGKSQRHMGLPPLKVGHAYHAEPKEAR